METAIQLLLLALGFVLLVKGADLFVDGASGLAAKFGIPQLVIGLTIVAMGTSTPEAAVSISAALNGCADITIGNIVGSNILNILIILGISCIICPLTVAKSTVKIEIPIMIIITILLFLLGYDGTVGRIDGLILLAAFIGYLAYLFVMTKNNKDNNENSAEPKNISLLKTLLFTFAGLVMIIYGSNLTVKSASSIARMLGLSERFIGLTIVALGTSLPELFTSVSAALKKNSDIAIGNIVGSNIFNILFIVGLSGLIIPVPFAQAFRFDTIVALLSAVALLVFCIRKNVLHRYAGVIMLLGYICYFCLIW